MFIQRHTLLSSFLYKETGMPFIFQYLQFHLFYFQAEPIILGSNGMSALNLVSPI